MQSLDNHVYRYRSCEIISNLFDKLAEHSISDEFLEEVQDSLLDRASVGVLINFLHGFYNTKKF